MKVCAIDIDDVLAGYVTACIEHYGYPIVWSWNLREMWPLVNWNKHFEPDNHFSFLLGLNPIAGAISGVQHIKDIGYDVLYLTASMSASAETRRLWFRIHDFPDLEMVCTNGPENKLEWIRKNKPDIVIDDLPSAAEEAWACGAYVVVMDCPWNRGVRVGRRARTWSEAVTVFLMPKMP